MRADTPKRKRGDMRTVLLGLAGAALLLAAPANAAVTPRTGKWEAKVSATEYVQLKVAKRGRARVVRLEKYQDRTPTSGCAVIPVGGFLGEPGRALKVGRTGRFRGSFGSFISPLGRRSVVVNAGRFSSSRKGRVTITANVDGSGQGSGCPKTSTFTIRRR